jgi:hypothetical protein
MGMSFDVLGGTLVLRTRPKFLLKSCVTLPHAGRSARTRPGIRQDRLMFERNEPTEPAEVRAEWDSDPRVWATVTPIPEGTGTETAAVTTIPRSRKARAE